MTEFQPNPEKLPVELLQKIFRNASKKNLLGFALVCKSWLYPVQTLLYYDISIKSLPQLKKFHSTIDNNHLLGTLVQNFEFVYLIDNNSRLEASSIIGGLLYNYVPYLETLNIPSLFSYIPLLDALTNSQLRQLKSINEPTRNYVSGEVANYVTYALLMKMRLERLVISDCIDSKNCEQLFFNRLYKRLYQFDNLTTIDVKRATDDIIQILEHIVESCPSLKEIKYNFKPSNPDGVINASISVKAILNFVPRLNIKILSNKSQDQYDEKTLMYIIHKFPGLTSFSSHTDALSPASFLEMNHQTVTQLLQYTSNISKCDVIGLRINEGTIGESFKNFWEANSSFGCEDIAITYADDAAETLGLSNKNKQKMKRTLHFITTQGWKHFNFLRESGKYLRKIHFELNHTDYGFEMEPIEFMYNIVMHCPHLQKVCLIQFTFGSSSFSAKRLNHKFSLDELYLDQCNWWSTEFLEQWSGLIPEIKQLRFSYCNQDAYADEDTDALYMINMRHTKVNSIIINDNFMSSSLYVKLVVADESDHCYHYRYSDDVKEMEEANEQEYLDAKEHCDCIDIYCRTKPIIVIE